MGSKGGKLLTVSLFLFLSTLLAIFLYYLSRPSGLLEIAYLDVGQGDAILVETPYGQNILIDAGESGTVMKPISEELPWWDKQIDLLVLTHPHSDHLGGMIEILRRFDVKAVMYTGIGNGEADYELWLRLIEEENARLIIISKPQKIVLGTNCVLEILYPFNGEDLKKEKNLNNTSIVAKLEYGENSFLFMGDAEEKIEKLLMDKDADLEADLLKVGHHGSDTSSNEDFLKAIGMQFAVISVGKDNDFGHPSQRVLKRFERLQTGLYRTDKQKTIKLTSDGKNLGGLEVN